MSDGLCVESILKERSKNATEFFGHYQDKASVLALSKSVLEYLSPEQEIGENETDSLTISDDAISMDNNGNDDDPIDIN